MESPINKNKKNIKNEILLKLEPILNDIIGLGLDDKIDVINRMRLRIRDISPFANEPVDCVLWVKSGDVIANDYNPNRVAPPEMELLGVSISEDGYTQPIVTFQNGDKKEVIDGFHRYRVGKEYGNISEKIYGHLPVVSIRKEKTGKDQRIASTIRHNRARGKHIVDAMSEIVLELKNRNWTNQRIGRELGMDEEEILRLCQITGLEDIFKDEDFSKSWNVEDSDIGEFEFTGEIDELEKEENNFRTINTDDPERIFHTYDKWECYKAGFYDTSKCGMTGNECELEFKSFLSNKKEFAIALECVITEWKYSCEHYLTNKSMNRIAWLRQASVCYARGIPSKYKSAFHLLTKEQQAEADSLALKYLNEWLKANNRKEVSIEEATGGEERQMEIY